MKKQSSTQPTVDNLSENSFAITHTSTSLKKDRRRIIFLVSVMMTLLFLVMNSSWLLAPIHKRWEQIFPLPPYNGPLIFIQDEANLLALRSTDGTIQWIRNLEPGSFIRHPNLNVVLVKEKNRIMELQASNGHIVWSAMLPSEFAQATMLLNGPEILLWQPPTYPQSLEGVQSFFMAINLTDGQMQWSAQNLGSPIVENKAGDVHSQAFCNIRQLGYSTITSIDIIVLDMKTGITTWESPSIRGTTTDRVQCYITSSHIFIEQRNGMFDKLHAYDRVTGNLQWESDFEAFVTALDSENLYLTTWDINQPSTKPNMLTEVNAFDGQLKWQLNGEYTFLDRFYLSKDTGTILMKTSTGIASIDKQDGMIIWRYQPISDSNYAWSTSQIERDTFYYTDLTHVYAILAKTGQVMWQIQLPLNSQRMLFYYDDKLFVQEVHDLIAYSVKDGAMSWRMSSNVQYVF